MLKIILKKYYYKKKIICRIMEPVVFSVTPKRQKLLQREKV